MWCWHRIRESESGLCPACRTPYGEDPHQFSAVDVAEVLKANKEKEEKAKKERERLRQQSSGNLNNNDDETGAMEVPKDRSSLANMRVIRRNLVYAVGLPPNCATEDTLRRPEYFGQYGKISKIVLSNRKSDSAAGGGGGDPRRASASAYVTFVHKEDTLACILALDGFYLENRNIRASYGTSKYCSAFIKNVRCNNPECTYLHEMGATEDTFTKQEIQAGYVTSGRDVQARQQQITAEQMRQGTVPPRKKVGGGGPSGTGKAASHPVLPAPEYDEPTRPTPALVPAPAGVSRTNTAPLSLNPNNIAAKLGRSSSVTITSSSGRSPTLASQATPAVAVAAASAAAAVATTASATHRKSKSAGNPNTTAASTATTAAKVVASGRAAKTESVDSHHATLTPLTPLKRASKSASARSASTGAQANSNDASNDKLTPLRNGTNNKKQNGARGASAGIGEAPSIPTTTAAAAAAAAATTTTTQSSNVGVSSIGGDVIGPPKLKPRAANVLTGIGGDPVAPSAADSLGGRPINMKSGDGAIPRSSALGGEVFTGHLTSGSISAVGSNTSPGQDVGGAALWDGAGGGATAVAAAAPNNTVGGSVISSRAPGPPSAAPAGSSSTALASILGINLPTGSGSLEESSNLWSAPAPAGPSPLSALNNSAVPTNDAFAGRQDYGGSSSLIGGVPIGGASSAPGTIGGGNTTDIALLQSLLPGVHITSGSDPMSFGGIGAGGGGWNGGAQNPSQGIGPGGLNGEVIGGSLHGGVPAAGAPMGPIGQNAGAQSQRRGPGIW